MSGSRFGWLLGMVISTIAGIRRPVSTATTTSVWPFCTRSPVVVWVIRNAVTQASYRS
jgi:hypothetical protein